MIILGLDPSLSSCGWGIVQADGNRLAHVANGQIKTKASLPLATRLADLAGALEAIVAEHRPTAAAALPPTAGLLGSQTMKSLAAAAPGRSPSVRPSS